MDKPVKEVMSGRPVSIDPDASALAALDLMIEHGFRHLPVLDAKRSLVGVVSFEDLRGAMPVPLSLSSPPSPETREQMLDPRVDEIMNDPIVAGPETPLQDAVQLLIDHRIGCLPVVDGDGGLAGILTERDLLEALVTVLWADSLGDRGRGSGSG